MNTVLLRILRRCLKLLTSNLSLFEVSKLITYFVHMQLNYPKLERLSLNKVFEGEATHFNPACAEMIDRIVGPVVGEEVIDVASEVNCFPNAPIESGFNGPIFLFIPQELV